MGERKTNQSIKLWIDLRSKESPYDQILSLFIHDSIAFMCDASSGPFVFAFIFDNVPRPTEEHNSMS